MDQHVGGSSLRRSPKESEAKKRHYLSIDAELLKTKRIYCHACGGLFTLGESPKLVFSFLAYRQRIGYHETPERYMVESLGCSFEAVHLATRKLERCGLIEASDRDRGSQRWNFYTVVNIERLVVLPWAREQKLEREVASKSAAKKKWKNYDPPAQIRAVCPADEATARDEWSDKFLLLSPCVCRPIVKKSYKSDMSVSDDKSAKSGSDVSVSGESGASAKTTAQIREKRMPNPRNADAISIVRESKEEKSKQGMYFVHSARIANATARIADMNGSLGEDDPFADPPFLDATRSEEDDEAGRHPRITDADVTQDFWACDRCGMRLPWLDRINGQRSCMRCSPPSDVTIAEPRDFFRSVCGDLYGNSVTKR